MANSQSLQTFDFQSKQVRTLTIDNQPWFVAADVCLALGLGDTFKAVERLDADEKGTNSVRTLGGEQQMTTVNESGLYSLILTSRKPEAKQFKRWVTREVLPAIRQTGGYQANVSPALGTMRFGRFDYHGTHYLLYLESMIRIAPQPLLALLGVAWSRWAEFLGRHYGAWGVMEVSENLPGETNGTLVMALGRTTKLLGEIGAEIPPDRRALYERFLSNLEATLLREWQNRYTPTRESLLAAEPLSHAQQDEIKAAVRGRLAGSDYPQAALLYVYGKLKKHFAVERWTEIKRGDFDAALALIAAADGRELLPESAKLALPPALIAPQTPVKRLV